eukprot:708453-Heterocapsa_arctica.AAC.1
MADGDGHWLRGDGGSAQRHAQRHAQPEASSSAQPDDQPRARTLARAQHAWQTRARDDGPAAMAQPDAQPRSKRMPRPRRREQAIRRGGQGRRQARLADTASGQEEKEEAEQATK